MGPIYQNLVPIENSRSGLLIGTGFIKIGTILRKLWADRTYTASLDKKGLRKNDKKNDRKPRKDQKIDNTGKGRNELEPRKITKKNDEKKITKNKKKRRNTKKTARKF